MSVLLALWLGFAALLGNPACLDQPTLRVVADAGPTALGTYEYPASIVSVERGLSPDLFRAVAIHEFVHHYWTVCHVDSRPLGRRFLRHTVEPVWTSASRERFAYTLTWVLTGRGLSSGLVDRDAARVFLPKIVDPTSEQLARMTG